MDAGRAGLWDWDDGGFLVFAEGGFVDVIMEVTMKDAADVAGFFAAHAVWSICEGETLIPIYAFVDADGQRRMERMAHQQLEHGVHAGKQRLEEPEEGVMVKVLIFDGRIPWEGGKLDALIVEWRDGSEPVGRAVVAIPYTPAAKKGFFRKAVPFAVHKPKVIDISKHWQDSIQEIFKAFFAGVSKHEHGAKVWNDHLDESK